MATSSNSSNNSINEESQHYPYPSHVNTANFLSIKLSGKTNYMLWREQMTCLLDSYDMLGFIDGTMKKPQKNSGSKVKVDVTAYEAMYREWKRSDTLVKGWIYGSLSEDVMGIVVSLETTNDLWNKLKTSYTTSPTTETPVSVTPPNTTTWKKDMGEYNSLCRAIQTGDWEKASDIFNDHKEALTDKLNIDGNRTLHIAVGNPENILFLQNLLEQINPVTLPTLVNTKLQNALHYAAMLDNSIAAKMLVEKNPRLLFTVDYQNYLPIQKAIFNSHKTTFLYLLRVCKQHIRLSKEDGNHNPFEGAKGVSLLNNTILSGFLDVAYDLLKDYPDLARIKVTNFKAPLWCIAKKWDAYPSAKQYNFYQRFVYSRLPTENYNRDFRNKNEHIENQEKADQVNMGMNSNYVYPDVPLPAYGLPGTYNNVDIENQETYRANLVTKCTQSYLPPDVTAHKIPDNENQEANNENDVTNCTKRYVNPDVSMEETYKSYDYPPPAYPADVPLYWPETWPDNVTKRKKSYVPPVIERIYVQFWKFALLHVQHIKNLYEDKVKHNTALLILNFICEEVGKLRSDHDEHYGDAFTVAVKNNTPEVIRQITQSFPQAIWTRNNGYSLSQLSIMNRCEHVYNYLVHEVTHDKYLHNVSVDKDENNILHLAGKLAPTHKLNMVTGATLQMQRELQWFQEVSKLVRPKDMEALNKKQETPIMVFRKEHKDLRQKGEEWMKKTADSYTITAALIVTIVFAAAITVPGGNNGDTGKVIFETKPSFIIFAVSDAISLFTSTTSLLLFLSILTARYAEEDFLYKLPKRLILGLVMLFMSVTTMMIAFSATLYIMFGQEKSWILIVIAAVTCLPIASFVTLQLPLLVDLISSTYGRGIFRKQTELRITTP